VARRLVTGVAVRESGQGDLVEPSAGGSGKSATPRERMQLANASWWELVDCELVDPPALVAAPRRQTTAAATCRCQQHQTGRG